MPWPTPHRAAISLTLDNLGEAADLHRGLWQAPIGTHPSITTSLPRILGLLSKHALRATYFAESWSLAVYPAVIAALKEQGHEVAWHGWQHEVWHALAGDEERGNFERSFAAAEGHGVVYEGFRPPGGRVNGRTWGLLREYGVRYVSPLGGFGVGEEGVVVLPFEWKGVDAFYYMESFGEIRKEYGEPEEVLGPEALKAWLFAKIDEVKRTGGYLSILFHPFLQTSEERFEVLEEVLRKISEDPDIWCAPCNQVAKWVLEHPDEFKTQV
ncbi:hypothetical protein B0T25DRAFT_458114 [Lasiosphaeria hispida]|uniref:NodB homology domain-containing protein n=1 Tax=Lasiosphaeria hispida TaxID=260671 RepID=A0AAJ0HDR5_9PEZI|nr:hypothetical protein B0T25DRAFT_458114 [Lasiosphaeria hispida]